MIGRLAFTAALLATIIVLPQVPTMIVVLGRLPTFAILMPIALTVWVAGTKTVLERNPR